MKRDIWISPAAAGHQLIAAGYTVDVRNDHVAYRKTGVLGKLNIHQQGVDGWAVMRLEDRGS